MSEFRDESFAVSQPWARWIVGLRDKGWEEGDYYFGGGSVSMYRDLRQPITTLHFIWRGRMYRRAWDKTFTQRGCAVLAGRFAREVIANAT